MSGAEVKCSLKMRPGAHEVQFIVKLVADGQWKIARHFNGGSRALELNTVPLGMAEMDGKTWRDVFVGRLGQGEVRFKPSSLTLSQRYREPR
jgi:hypothetical protein